MRKCPKCGNHYIPSCPCEGIPAVRNAALEEAAKVADSKVCGYMHDREEGKPMCNEVVKAILSLKDQELESCQHVPEQLRESGNVNGDATFCEKCSQPLIHISSNKVLFTELQEQIVLEPVYQTIEKQEKKS